jgi:hypothetical protein
VSFGAFSEINWLAIGACVLLSFGISFVWYVILFQKPWLRALGIRAEDVRDLQMGTVAPYATALVTYVVLGTVTALFVAWLGLRSVPQGLALGALTFVAYNLTAFARLVFFEDRPLALLWIDAGADLLTHLAFGAILAAWR